MLRAQKRILLPAAALLVAALLLIAPIAGAIGEGQIEGGDIYRVSNASKGSGFANTANADPCDTVQFKVRLHNPGPGDVTSTLVRATLPSGASTTHTSTVTISGQNMQPATTSDTATVNLSHAQTIGYQSGSTQLLNANGGVIRALPDGIVGGGVSIGTVGVSLKEIVFVQFKAVIPCKPQPPKPPEPPQPPKPPVTPPTPEQPTPPPTTTTTLSQIKAADQPAPAPAAAPTALPEAGPADVIGVFASVVMGGMLSYHIVFRRLANLL
jgi:uncharacterized repeat protein (TIGR01451 family)